MIQLVAFTTNHPSPTVKNFAIIWPPCQVNQPLFLYPFCVIVTLLAEKMSWPVCKPRCNKTTPSASRDWQGWAALEKPSLWLCCSTFYCSSLVSWAVCYGFVLKYLSVNHFLFSVRSICSDPDYLGELSWKTAVSCQMREENGRFPLHKHLSTKTGLRQIGEDRASKNFTASKAIFASCFFLLEARNDCWFREWWAKRILNGGCTCCQHIFRLESTWKSRTNCRLHQRSPLNNRMNSTEIRRCPLAEGHLQELAL